MWTIVRPLALEQIRNIILRLVDSVIKLVYPVNKPVYSVIKLVYPVDKPGLLTGLTDIIGFISR